MRLFRRICPTAVACSAVSRLILPGVILFCLAVSPLLAEAPTGAAAASAEARAARAFDAARNDGPPALHAFLYRMPKGGDLHVHLSGAVYAETFIKDAGEDGMCVSPTLLRFDRATRTPECPTGEVPASTITSDQHLYDELIDAFSMRTFIPVTGEDGHDHFFDTFDRFGGTDKRHKAEWVDEVATRGAAQNEQYLELMDTPDFSRAAALAEKVGYTSDFVAYRQKLLDGGIRDSIPAIQATYDRVDADRKALEHCGDPGAEPACHVQVRYIYQILRGMPPAVVFAQVILGLETASVDPQFAGLNFVQPEDGYISMRDYRLQMQMLDAVHRFYPKVHISLHAGELSPGMVPPDGLTFHIRSAVEQGHAERIGHGVDVMYEDRPYELLKEMAAKHILVEINLTSNDVILNIKGNEHPFMLYRKYGVPVALSTDDEGVSRIDLTHEYVRAAVTYPLSYGDLKQMARASVEHAFLPGESLWERFTLEKLGTPVAACRGQVGNETPAGRCAEFVRSSEKAQQEWELERRFHAFEASF
ncbi:adenosine deaminase family protein [Paracidobacterium acidisoli]|uniref:adenosine deaminase n=1 Tax=Paracidobacterium acidisoli TaxID=2303751 RepID=A0A372INJ0_9BACT|nr:adenosine deaminase [Paracidobacterium acidisoli]MBT9331973.1 adenosine deaminase [Paracidobacterium acidisoli]